MSAFAFIKTLVVVVLAAFVYIILDYAVNESVPFATEEGLLGAGTFGTMLLHIWSVAFLAVLFFAVMGGIIESMKRRREVF